MAERTDQFRPYVARKLARYSWRKVVAAHEQLWRKERDRARLLPYHPRRSWGPYYRTDTSAHFRHYPSLAFASRDRGRVAMADRMAALVPSLAYLARVTRLDWELICQIRDAVAARREGISIRELVACGTTPDAVRCAIVFRLKHGCLRRVMDLNRGD